MCEKYLVRLKKSLIVDTFGYFNQYESQHKEKDFTPVSFEHLKFLQEYIVVIIFKNFV